MIAKKIIETIKAAYKSIYCNYMKLNEELVEAETLSTCISNILATCRIYDDKEEILEDGSIKTIRVDKNLDKVSKIVLLSLDDCVEVEMVAIYNSINCDYIIIRHNSVSGSTCFVIEKKVCGFTATKLLDGGNEISVSVFNLLKYFPIKEVENIINIITSSVRWLNEAKVY